MTEPRIVTVGDIATVHRGYEDPPSYLVRARGQDAVLLGVVMDKGVNGLQLGERIDAFLAQERSALPLEQRIGSTSRNSPCEKIRLAGRPSSRSRRRMAARSGLRSVAA